ncbi:hypothetical protein [Planococcus alpniumensis]|uniref:hypothetical protein n=1 Tax=Planococcus alpniumensis TaxID=2708345 RepID=UPI001B8D17EE|nr:hypothetical protein [Planococcus sp. MSAK28401]
MKYEKKALDLAIVEESEMRSRGTTYRQKTAQYVLHFFTETVQNNKPLTLSREEIRKLVLEKYQLDTDRADDVSKNIWILLAKVKDEDRLAELYSLAKERIKNRNVDS